MRLRVLHMWNKILTEIPLVSFLAVCIWVYNERNDRQVVDSFLQYIHYYLYMIRSHFLPICPL